MNMMSKIYASTAMSPVELKEHDAMTCTIARATGETQVISPSGSEWDNALAAYSAARASSDTMPLGTIGEDEAVDTYCDLMDHLIENVPSPDGDALATKLMLAFDRCEEFSFFDRYKEPIIADARRLGLAGQRGVPEQTNASGPTSSEVVRARWDATLTAYTTAKAKYDALPAHREDDNPEMMALLAAEDELIMTPAADLAALRTKMDLEYFRNCQPGAAEWKAIKSDVERLAANAGAPRFEGLSPAMTDAVLNWKALSAAYNEACDVPDVDEERTGQLCHLSANAAKALGATPSKTMEDFALKVYLLALVECGQNGPSPLNFEPGDDDFEETALWRGIIGDLPQISPSVRALIDGTLAEAESDTPTCHSRPEQPATPDEAYQQGKTSLSPTPIEVLQRLWDQANAAYDLNEEAEGKCSEDERGEDARALHREAASRLAKKATLLSHSILRQHPFTWRDALHVACHAFNMVDLGQDMNDEDWTALAAGMDGLLAFIADEAEGDEPLTGWNGDALRYVRTRVRTRRCAELKAA